MLSFPAGRNDDCVDVLGLFGELLDRVMRGRPLRPKKPKSIRNRWNDKFERDDDDRPINWKLM